MFGAKRGELLAVLGAIEVDGDRGQLRGDGLLRLLGLLGLGRLRALRWG